MTKLVSTFGLVLLGLAVLGTVGPGIAVVLNALVPVVLVAAVAVAVLRVVWWYTRKW
jgi:hypothetical protein